MSGHSKWSTIKRKKGAADARRGKVFTQLIRELTVAARHGGGDPVGNPRLRMAIDKARAQNMPKDNIERAVKKGTGELAGESYEEIRYEGYGPGGVAIIVDAVTDNRNRTVSELRHLFSKFGGNLGSTGCVAYLFEPYGVLLFDTGDRDADALAEAAIEADASDVIEDGDTLEIRTEPQALHRVQAALEEAGFSAESASLQLVPSTTQKLSGKEAQTMLRLYEALDLHEDVNQVYANFDISDDEMRQLMDAG
ncbi:MAG: YebC/PmpR family DNA-binding transcriptional regulator [Myxococcota bacterium]